MHPIDAVAAYNSHLNEQCPGPDECAECLRVETDLHECFELALRDEARRNLGVHIEGCIFERAPFLVEDGQGRVLFEGDSPCLLSRSRCEDDVRRIFNSVLAAIVSAQHACPRHDPDPEPYGCEDCARLAEIRKADTLTVTELAAWLGMSRAALLDWWTTHPDVIPVEANPASFERVVPHSWLDTRLAQTLASMARLQYGSPAWAMARREVERLAALAAPDED